MRLIVNKEVTYEEALALIKEPRDKIALDIETVSLENTLPLGIGIAVSKSLGFYFFNIKDELAHQMIDTVQTILLQNSAFDIPILKELGYHITNYEDTMLAAYSAGVLDNSLSELSQAFFLQECPTVTSLWREKDQGNVGIDHIKLGQICMTHACLTYALDEIIPKTALYQNIDKPCIELVMEMEKWGLLIDQYTLTKVEQSVMNKVTPLELELKMELGVDNLFSNPQIAKALRVKGIIGTRKTKSAKDSVSKESLKPLNLPITNKLLKYRSLMKNLTTYVPAFRNVDKGGRLHTQFGYTRTGRWSSSKPNHQNITRDEKFQEE